MHYGGIDIGGTKIEARLFDGASGETLEVRRVATPQAGFAPFLEAVADQLGWLEAQAGGTIPVGLSLAGVTDAETGVCFASNIPVTGRALGPELAALTGRDLPVVNDCMAFTYSEAVGGAGTGKRAVMGLILGTGVGGGLCIDGTLPPRHAGLAVEVGHVGLSARALARHGLPLLHCGCGRLGCIENYISGTGMANLAEWRMGARMSPEELLASDDPAAAEVLDIWSDLAGDCLYTIQVMLDPDCIVIGGGLSKMPAITERLEASLAAQRLADARLPTIALAVHGDSSGARGAALIARDQWTSSPRS